MKPSDESCKLCRFAGEKQYFNDYPCHRRAPMVRMVAGSQDIRMHVPTFPIMNGDDWCGEFQAETAGGTDRQTEKIDPIAFRLSKAAAPYEPCGGCGCDDPDKRCVGCMHTFSQKVTTSPERAQISAESERIQCPRCPALMPLGLSCKGNPPDDPCPLRREK